MELQRLDGDFSRPPRFNIGFTVAALDSTLDDIELLRPARRSSNGHGAPSPLSISEGEHACLLYADDPLEQLPVIAPFFAEGLAAGERCIYIADDLTVDEVSHGLRANGVAADEYIASGSLCLWTRETWRQPGPLESASKAQQVQGLIADALRSGFSGVRFAVEMTWTLGPDIDAACLRHWEATINTLFGPGVPARIICQYSRARLAPAVIGAGLSTHPIAFIGAESYDNPFYEASLILAEGPGALADRAMQAPDSARIDWMVGQLLWCRQVQEEREARLRAEWALAAESSARSQLEGLHREAEAMAQELRKANSAKDEFLALVSHELRTPVTVILGNASLLLRRGESMDSFTRKQVFADLQDDASRLAGLVTNLLVLSKVEHSGELEREPVHLAHVADSVVRDHRKQHAAREVSVLTTGTPIGLGHEGYVSDILRNLLSNAEKYSPSDSTIEVLISEERSEAMVRVLDRGIGLAPEEMASLFSLFYRSPRAEHLDRGLGIGLSVCKRLIEAQGGRIWATPREGAGSEFGFALPSGRREGAP
jgi:signal transduction histidine kinase